MNKGFSLFEVLIVMAIFTGILFVVVGFRGNIQSLENLLSQRLQSRQDIEQSMQILETEIRSAGQSSLGAYPIDAASTSSLTFYSDIDKDTLAEKVRYFLSTSTIRKGVIKPSGNPLVYAVASETLATVVQNIVLTSSSVPIFQYYNSAYTGTQAPLTSPIDTTAIRLIQISISADIKASSSPKAEFFTNTMTIRNLRSN